MEKFVAHPFQKDQEGLVGTARIPGDKSISHRALMLGSLAEGITQITGLLESEDVLHTAKALLSLGITVTPAASKDEAWSVHGAKNGAHGFKKPRSALYMGNSGTGTRLMMGLVAGQGLSASFIGDTSLNQRPMGRIMKPLSQMGASFDTSNNDRLPIRIKGSKQLRGIHYVTDVASAQVKSAILLAGLYANGETVITENEATRDHSERLLSYMGADIHIEKDAHKTTIRLMGHCDLKAQKISVPADPSSAAFLVVAALVSQQSKIVVPNVCINATRFGLFTTLLEMNADISFENKKEICGESIADIHVNTSHLKGVTVPAERIPFMIDEIPILAVAASFATGTTTISGLSELRVKESDRLSATMQGLMKAGVRVSEKDDTLIITGTGLIPEGGCLIETHADHRIAMSFLVMGLSARNPILIDDGSTISTSFPGFVKLMNDLGARISPEDTDPS